MILLLVIWIFLHILDIHCSVVFLRTREIKSHASINMMTEKNLSWT